MPVSPSLRASTTMAGRVVMVATNHSQHLPVASHGQGRKNLTAVRYRPWMVDQPIRCVKRAVGAPRSPFAAACHFVLASPVAPGAYCWPARRRGATRSHVPVSSSVARRPCSSSRRQGYAPSAPTVARDERAFGRPRRVARCDHGAPQG
jgi:hypothetical protein